MLVANLPRLTSVPARVVGWAGLESLTNLCLCTGKKNNRWSPQFFRPSSPLLTIPLQTIKRPQILADINPGVTVAIIGYRTKIA